MTRRIGNEILPGIAGAGGFDAPGGNARRIDIGGEMAGGAFDLHGGSPFLTFKALTTDVTALYLRN